MVSSVGVSSLSLTLSSSNNVSLSPSSTGGSSSLSLVASPALTSSVSQSASSSGAAISTSPSSVRLQASSVVSSTSLSLSAERSSSTISHISSTASVTSLDQSISTTGSSAPVPSARSTPLPKSSDRKSGMAGPSSSTSATFSSTSQASPAKSTTPTSTSKAPATTETSLSQTVSADQNPTPSSTSKSSSTATSSGGGDLTTATTSTPESHPTTSSGTQIAIPSHRTDSGSAAPTASDQGGTVTSGGSGGPTSPAAPHTSSPNPFAPSDDGSKASAIAQPSSRPPVTTSTITDKPETTLSTPVFLTVTDAQNRTTISEPPVFTSVEVTTSNGVQVSITHVVANPTGIWGVDEASSSHGFFSKSGAVAGVFLVVGLVIAAIFAGIFLYFRRRRRRRAPIFIESISRPLPMPDDPFEDPRTLLPQPEMTYAGYVDGTLVIAGAATPHPTPFDSDLDHGSRRSSEARPSGEHVRGLGLAGVGTGGGYGDSSQSSFHSRPRQPSQRGPVGLAITTDIRRDSTRSGRREPSSAQSSPSIYPPSLPTPSGEDNHSLVNVALSNDDGATRFTNASATRLSSPTTRKPVPAHDLPEPVAPVPRSSQQQQAEQTSPPVIPPRSPLRRNSTATSRSLSSSPPPFRLANIQTQFKNSKLANATLQPYEPLTPPTSFASLSPAESSSGHEALTPVSPADAIAAANPFSDAHAQQIPHADIVTAFPMTRSGNKRETFYTRTRGSQRRPSIEWRQPRD